MRKSNLGFYRLLLEEVIFPSPRMLSRSRSARDIVALHWGVSMHNIPEGEIFRPGAWIEFGAIDPLGADFRASTNFGSLYGK